MIRRERKLPKGSKDAWSRGNAVCGAHSVDAVRTPGQMGGRKAEADGAVPYGGSTVEKQAGNLEPAEVAAKAAAAVGE